jgi:autotransporter-associated beta strand protein
MSFHLLTSRQAIALTAGILILPVGASPFWTFDNEGGDANFGNALNWDSNTVPGQDQGAVVNVFSPNVPLLITSNQTVDTLRINDGRTVTQTGGTLTIANSGNQFERGLWIGEFGWNNVYNMQGGSIVIHDDFDGLILGKAGGAQGILNFSGGTITNTAGDTFIGADQEGVWNQSGGTFTGGTVYLARWGSPNVEKGFLNLDGGTFAATRVQKGDGNEAFFNFNGGTLQARASVSDFFHSMTRANVRNGGATIDTNGFDVTVSQALLHSDIGGDAAIDGGLRKTGSGTLVLTGFNTYTGDTNIDAGTLAVAGGGSFYNGGATGNIKVNNGGTLRFDRTDTFGNAGHTNPVTLTVNAGGNVLSNGQFNSIRNVALNGGTITANGGLFIAGPGDIGAYGLTGTVTANGAATSTIANGGGGSNFIRIGREGTSEATTFDVTNAAGVLDVNVELRDNFGATSGLAKTGAGTLVLDANSSHSGATTVSAGTLVVNGTLSGTGAVNIAAGATLAGTGTIGGNTTISGIHTPGSSPGLQSFGGNLAYAGSAAEFVWDVSFTTGDNGTPVNGGDAYDRVNVAGDLSGTGDATFRISLDGGDFSDAFWSVNRSWSNVFTASNAFDLNQVFESIDFDDGLDPGGYGSFSFTGSTLEWTSVPEPRAAMIGSFGLLCLLRRRR